MIHRVLPPAPLAQSADTGSVLVWSLVLILLLVGAFVGVMYLRKWVRDEEDEPENQKIGFTLGDLRRLHQRGQLSDEEFEKARVQMIAATQRAAERAAEAARQAAKERGGHTDVDEIRARAKRNRQAGGGAAEPPGPGEPRGPGDGGSSPEG